MADRAHLFSMCRQVNPESLFRWVRTEFDGVSYDVSYKDMVDDHQSLKWSRKCSLVAD